MRLSASHLVGRDEELGAIAGFLDARERLPGVVVLPGEPGVGKTSLWLAGVHAAADRGYRIASARPAETETGLSFAGVADLLGTAASDVLTELPPVQRRALEAALLLGESEARVDERAVAAAFLGAVRLLAGEGLCVAVDDVQWLDAASLGAVRYALARLDDEPVAVLLSVRGGVPAWLRRAVPEDRLRTIEAGSLSLGATQELLRARLDATFPRPTLIRLWETSRGNPFFALELAAALQRKGGALAPSEELPIPTDLDQLLHARLDGLGSEALQVAHVVAALADPTTTLLEAALGARSDPGLAEALAAGVVELDDEHVRFTHPLLGSAAVARQTPTRRRALHARLAEIVPTLEERARHLAQATAGPDGEIASTLERAARSAQERGAPATAAELAEQALRLTPPADGAGTRRRLLLVAELSHATGDTGRAIVVLERARAEAAPGGELASVLAHLAQVQPGPREAVALYEEALVEASGDDALEAKIQLNLAELMRFHEGLERGIAYAEQAVRAAARVEDAALRCSAIAVHELLRFNAGHGVRRDVMDEARALERTLPQGLLAAGPTWALSHQLVWSVDLASARALLLEFRDAFAAQDDADGESAALWYLGLLEWRAGNWDEADRVAADSLALSTQLGRPAHPADFPAAIVAAHRGRTDEARALAGDGVAWGEAEGIRVGLSGYSWVLGFVELSLGDTEAALAQLRRSYGLRPAHDPGMRLELGDVLEALIAAGELDEADEILATWEPRAVALDRAWALAILARGRGLLLAARRDLEGATVSFERSLAEHARCADPFQHARTLLSLGKTQRRAKKRAAARATLEDALARFELLGAPLWADQARAELSRIGGRAPSRDELTEAERRIAGLVADGRTNREVAAALFLTEHSVETALTRVYRKLGVRSRSELASRLAKA